MKYFHYCPECKVEGVKTTEMEIRYNKLGTDGYGQPVRFMDCVCGSKLNGFLYLDFYIRRGQEIDAGFIDYLKHRISFYYEGIVESDSNQQ